MKYIVTYKEKGEIHNTTSEGSDIVTAIYNFYDKKGFHKIIKMEIQDE